MDQTHERRRGGARERIDRYLDASGLAAARAEGRAAHRRRLRPPLFPGSAAATATQSCSRCTPGRSISPRCRSPTSRTCCSKCRCRCRAFSATRTRTGIVALEDLGDVTLQAHLGAASPAEHAALYREAVALIEHAAAARRRARLGRLPSLRDRLRRREADVGARLLREALPRGYRGAALSAADRAALARSGRRSPASWRRNRACSAIATITAAT